jgi:hypothetical protein
LPLDFLSIPLFGWKHDDMREKLGDIGLDFGCRPESPLVSNATQPLVVRPDGSCTIVFGQILVDRKAFGQDGIAVLQRWNFPRRIYGKIFLGPVAPIQSADRFPIERNAYLLRHPDTARSPRADASKDGYCQGMLLCAPMVTPRLRGSLEKLGDIACRVRERHDAAMAAHVSIAQYAAAALFNGSNLAWEIIGFEDRDRASLTGVTFMLRCDR